MGGAIKTGHMPDHRGRSAATRFTGRQLGGRGGTTKGGKMKTPKDLSGQQYGRLTVTNQWERRKMKSRNRVYWLCECSCGASIWAQAAHLTGGNTKSCGCLRENRARQAEIAADEPEMVKAALPVKLTRLEARRAIRADTEFEDGVEHEPRIANNPKYQLVVRKSRTGTFYGVYLAEWDCERIISPNKQEALAEIRRLLREDEMDRLPWKYRMAA
jgi:hypothetical protein